MALLPLLLLITCLLLALRILLFTITLLLLCIVLFSLPIFPLVSSFCWKNNYLLIFVFPSSYSPFPRRYLYPVFLFPFFFSVFFLLFIIFSSTFMYIPPLPPAPPLPPSDLSPPLLLLQ